jgi:hypothetical protein
MKEVDMQIMRISEAQKGKYSNARKFGIRGPEFEVTNQLRLFSSESPASAEGTFDIVGTSTVMVRIKSVY